MDSVAQCEPVRQMCRRSFSECRFPYWLSLSTFWPTLSTRLFCSWPSSRINPTLGANASWRSVSRFSARLFSLRLPLLHRLLPCLSHRLSATIFPWWSFPLGYFSYGDQKERPESLTPPGRMSCKSRTLLFAGLFALRLFEAFFASGGAFGGAFYEFGSD